MLAKGTISLTVSQIHKTDKWVELGKQLEGMGCHSICIKDMAGLLKPYVAYDIISRLKETVRIPIALHTHDTTGMSTTAIIKAIEAGVDYVDTSISSMSMTYGHSATESIVTILEGTPRDTGLNLQALEEIAAYFRNVRQKYARFEGALKGVDSRILVAQVPGGMFSNMENQLREQGATGKIDQVLAEIPHVRQDLGYVPLVTPTSQIVGTQAVLNVLMKQRYKIISKETAALLRGEYGATPAPVNAELQSRVLAGKPAMRSRPGDHLEPEIQRLQEKLQVLAREKNFNLAENLIEDVLTYALFPDAGLKFLENRGNPAAFEPVPNAG